MTWIEGGRASEVHLFVCVVFVCDVLTLIVVSFAYHVADCHHMIIDV